MANSYAGYTLSTKVSVDGMLDLAEARIYKDIDFPHARQTSVGVLVTGNNALSLSALSSTYPLIIRHISISGSGISGQSFLEPRDLSFLYEFWPDATQTGIPRFYAQTADLALRLAATPNANFAYELHSTLRPIPMSGSKANDWLGDNAPDVLLKALMLEVTTYHKGEQAQVGETPAAPGFWQTQYQRAIEQLAKQQGLQLSDAYMMSR